MLDQATRLREIAERYCSRPAGIRPHTIAVASGKGGVGKSTVALNLAVLLAANGAATLLLDADENLGNLDVMAGVAPKHRLGSVLSGERDVHDVLVPLSERLALLPADSGSTDYRQMTIEQQRTLLNEIADLEQRFAYVVIDTAAGLGTDVIGFVVRSDEAIIVITPEPTAVMDAYALIKLVTAADPMVPLRVVINNARSAGEAEETVRKLQTAVRHFLKRHVHFLGSIPADPHIGKAVVQQTPVVKAFPLCHASLSLSALTETVMEQTERTRGRRFATV
ncbi:MAG: hypothetical protein C4326_00595 [Ignavibacteria bacterium]